MARKRKTKKDEDEGALSPRTVLVALLIAALAAGAAHLLKHPATKQCLETPQCPPSVKIITSKYRSTCYSL